MADQDRCWLCGQRGIIRGDGIRRCSPCDVEWLDTTYWLAGSGRGSYAEYQRGHRAVERGFMKRYEIQMVDFSQPGAPSSPA